ncbi:VOC family protein [Maricurvus nonylphenolicus]|uniref:VOC family protein n=1 Tax=Maricurvus nonylphenolicus TaxID=1008307 RepID=UPI0036F2F8ED
MSDTQTINGINHLALATANLKSTLQFFNEVLGMPLVALYWMHGAENTAHAFLKLNDSSLLAFVFSPNIPTDIKLGITHSGNPGDPCTTGTMQHLAFNVDSHEQLLIMRDRIRSKGIHCFGPMDHGFAEAIYFSGPDGITLEVATLTGKNVKNWIDPEVVSAMGISSDELHVLENPEAFEQPPTSIPNQPIESASQLRMSYPEDLYSVMVNMTDNEFTETTRDAIPPTQLENG